MTIFGCHFVPHVSENNVYMEVVRAMSCLVQALASACAALLSSTKKGAPIWTNKERCIQSSSKKLQGLRNASPRNSLDPSQLINFLIVNPFWSRGAHDNILTSFVSNSHFGKRSVARDMTIFGSHVGPHLSKNANSDFCFFQNWAAKPYHGLVFNLLLLPRE